MRVFPLTDEHKHQLDGLIDETILPALAEDFNHEVDRNLEKGDDLSEDYNENEYELWHNDAIAYLITKLQGNITITDNKNENQTPN